MKKLLLIAAASTALLTSSISFADCDIDSSTNSSMSSSIENQWYLKLNAGGVMFNKMKPKGKDFKLKTNTGFVGNVGVGYYIMDNLRTDLTIGAVTSAHLRKSTTGKNSTDSSSTLKHKPTIVSALLNGYIDFVDLSMFKVFAGAGVGLAMVKEKVTGKEAIAIVSDKNTISNDHHLTTKNKTNFAYQLSLGTSFELAQGIKVELVYAWIDYGKTKTTTKTIHDVQYKYGGTRYKGNNLMAGLRFDI
ncbi:outer membrane protein [Rickettsia typhi]|uniref:Possible outer surface protein n=2 Tax=Rickettsia typhi TaxID=785 RepID=Q68Y06_RICTY|nr:outer membrane protein [Rickettsia typhi]AAU04270.1 possible outer surface protein [Rickettsia typhi str. Wilmington]AFE54648.1 outer surface protein [Rickettsia typhi str. TH1527]AFE55486.1 outer surface protein [Rickettsia typhi str. B9991CWPP]